MIAFETLWAQPGMTEKRIAAIFSSGLTPTQALQEQSGLFPNDLKMQVESYLGTIRANFSLVLQGDFEYPDCLKLAEFPIPLFYYKGNLDLIYKQSLSVVGTRNCTNEGIQRAERLSKKICEQDFVVVSGLAEGIDTVALKTAMKAGGQVIAVIGTPINEYYPKENNELQNEIATNHLLISQVPFYRYHHEPFSARRHYFPRRNVTMSAISKGTIIVEASDTSGTLIQARSAIAQQKKLFILNSCFDVEGLEWPKKYLEKGAIRVKDADDIFTIVK